MAKRAQPSRLTTNREKQNRKQVITFTAGIIILIILLFEFGPPLVNFFGDTVYNLRGNSTNSSSQTTDSELLQPPVFSDIPDATQSAYVSFSGSAPDKNGTVEIYVNDSLEDKIDIGDSTDFSVDSLQLSKGNNVVKARFVKGNLTSGYTKDFGIMYYAQKPDFTLSNPQDGATFTRADQKINVTGSTDPQNTVTVNGFRAIVDSDGNFSYLLGLNNGDNTITISAQNPAGTSTQKQIKVTYNP